MLVVVPSSDLKKDDIVDDELAGQVSPPSDLVWAKVGRNVQFWPGQVRHRHFSVSFSLRPDF